MRHDLLRIALAAGAVIAVVIAAGTAIPLVSLAPRPAPTPLPTCRDGYLPTWATVVRGTEIPHRSGWVCQPGYLP